MESEPYDLITMGRLGVDLYPLQSGVGLDRAETFAKFLGGSPANVAVAAARLGRRTALVSRTGADPFGRYLRRELRTFGVDARWVTEVEEYPTPVTFCELFPPDDFPLHFYRRPKAPDLEIHPDALDLDAIRAARVFWATGTGLCAEPSRTATLTALRARSGRETTVLDLDWRPMFWPDPARARPYYAEALRYATVAVGNLDECEVATGERDPLAAARALFDAGGGALRLAVVKQGPAGVLALAADGTSAEVPPLPVEVVNGLGAGDAFGGALVHGLLAGLGLETLLRRAGAAGSIVAGRLACSSAMPYAAEIDEALTKGTGTLLPTTASPTPGEGPGPVEDPGSGPVPVEGPGSGAGQGLASGSGQGPGSGAAPGSGPVSVPERG
ncbi:MULTISPECIES: 5-dehydro-2-deoxygluconokinase [unclassified Streptomyces]|uniref:5-dehydro-2-deoxygluconokinase n=1 Tax=unclassified Streptomyces TaxID=2593676 RepID=UPI002948BD5E|nr:MULTISPECIES: 5-dehydro-2-deoxygluconokinase [unclassified Streptomyces]